MSRVNGTVKFFNLSGAACPPSTRATRSPSRSRTTAAAAASRLLTSNSPASAKRKTDWNRRASGPAVFFWRQPATLNGRFTQAALFCPDLNIHSLDPNRLARELVSGHFAGPRLTDPEQINDQSNPESPSCRELDRRNGACRAGPRRGRARQCLGRRSCRLWTRRHRRQRADAARSLCGAAAPSAAGLLRPGILRSAATCRALPEFAGSELCPFPKTDPPALRPSLRLD